VVSTVVTPPKIGPMSSVNDISSKLLLTSVSTFVIVFSSPSTAHLAAAKSVAIRLPPVQSLPS